MVPAALVEVVVVVVSLLTLCAELNPGVSSRALNKAVPRRDGSLIFISSILLVVISNLITITLLRSLRYGVYPYGAFAPSALQPFPSRLTASLRLENSSLRAGPFLFRGS